MDRDTVLSVKGLKKIYEGNDREVLGGIDLDVYYGDFLCVLGPSGCGKSTLIRCITGFENYEGIIDCMGVPVRAPGPERSMVFQDFAQLFPWKTVLGNITYPLKVNGIKDKNERNCIAKEYLETVNLSAYGDYYPHQLSGGMKQRVAIARSLALKPKVILMDEPFAALDAMTRNRMQAELLRIKEKTNMTVIFVTHNIQESIVLGNRIIVMSKQGEVKEEMTVEIEKPASPASEGFGELWQHLNSLLNE